MSTQFTVSQEETLKIIGDFLDMGHVDNIIAMFRHDNQYYPWAGNILTDERFNVRLGLMILFEELVLTEGDAPKTALPSLIEVLGHKNALYRGEALALLGIIGDTTALPHIQKCLHDVSPQVVEAAQMALDDLS